MLYSVYKQEGIYFSDFVYTQQTTLNIAEDVVDVLCPQLAPQWMCYQWMLRALCKSESVISLASLSCASQRDEFSAMHFLVVYNAFDPKIIKRNKLQNTLKVFPFSFSLSVLLDLFVSGQPSSKILSQYLGEMLFIKQF